MKKSGTGVFKFVYFIYLCVLLLVSICCIAYVGTLLTDYEEAQPERRVSEAVELMSRDAADGTIWNSISFPQVETGKFEKGVDLQKIYTDLLKAGNLDFSPKVGVNEEGKLIYNIESDGFILAEVVLKAVGEPVTKLAVFNYQEWKIASVRPILEAREYTLSVPADFKISLNGVELSEDEVMNSNESGIDYKVTGLYMKPSFKISDKAGNVAKYSIKGGRVIPELYNYTLTLPSSLTVKLNGELHDGEKLSDGRIKHDIRLLTKPEVKISDLFGNIVNYEGGNDLPLTYMSLRTTDKHTVTVAGSSVPAAAVTDAANIDFEAFSAYVEGLPKIKEYNIAILKKDADIVIKDDSGAVIEFEKGTRNLDLTAITGLDSIPADISAEVDVLQIAKNWSLFTSQDLSFYEVAKSLIKSSYQYQVATKYANGIDITFTSVHTLMDPPFTDESVKNFVQYTDSCFSVDISFVKHMLLSDGQVVDVPMNDTCFFVKYDDPDNYNDTLSWKLVGMKAVVNDAE